MKKIKLRSLTLKDLPKTLSWNNQEDIEDLYSGHPFPVNLEMETKWYDKILTSNFPTTVFGLELLEIHELIGISLLKDINMINREAGFAIYIGESKYRGQGLALEATKSTLLFGFYKMNLNRISLKVLARNSDAIKLYEKVGFQKEGILHESIFKNNRFEDEIIMYILKRNFDEQG